MHLLQDNQRSGSKLDDFDKWLMCVLAARGNPELEARRDELIVRIILFTLCHISHLTSEFLLLGAASVTSGPCAHYSYSFLDINPLSKGHALVIPKCPVSTLSPLDVGVLNGLFLFGHSMLL